jgi:hypothetical protein
MLVGHTREEKTPFSRMPTLSKDLKECGTIVNKKSMKGSIEFNKNESFTNRDQDLSRRRDSEGVKGTKKVQIIPVVSEKFCTNCGIQF